MTGIEDSFYWMDSQNGKYTVQFGYKAWMKKKEMERLRRREEAGTSYEETTPKTWNSLWQENVS